ncbi:hypothetical protein [Prevotella sp. tf2-5]|uniref:hypothetical protein n=1 Tax=Prevotella sp. tf2-5 TaxID=1761889 RepID=UPI0008EBFEC8|nr:hypothetical protein [Prevotella sp. tf2-5]SFP12207.1 hypothetical protein SAMN04487852_1172 [Prevotella sp. tf2-5]
MRKIFLLAAFVCFAALSVSAQTEESESKTEKMLRLTKTANENPTDWKAQLEAGHFLLDKEKGVYNQSQAEKYYERIYHLATDYNKEIPDSVIRETGFMLMSVAADKKNFDKALFYIDAMTHARRVGVDISDEYMNSIDVCGIMYSMIKEDMVKPLAYIMNIRERLTKNKTPGIEYTDVLTTILFERLMEKYKDMFGDKMMELTLDDKKYIMISKGDWNIEKPLVGWMQKEEGSPMVLYGEDGKVYDDKHGKMEYGFDWYKNGVVPKEGVNMRLITVTPERRQQMVEAYRNYLKNAKKNK